MLGPYIISTTPYFISRTHLLYCCTHVMPILLLLHHIEAHYFYYCALKLLLLCRLSLCYEPLDSYI